MRGAHLPRPRHPTPTSHLCAEKANFIFSYHFHDIAFASFLCLSPPTSSSLPCKSPPLLSHLLASPSVVVWAHCSANIHSLTAMPQNFISQLPLERTSQVCYPPLQQPLDYLSAIFHPSDRQCHQQYIPEMLGIMSR